MKNRIGRVYAETSVVSGMFDDDEHPILTRSFWDAVFKGDIRIVVSDILEQEVNNAPEHVRDFFASIPESQIERINSTIKSNDLANRYILGRVVGKSSLNDCKHIALATIAGADAIVSWNFKDIVKRRDGYKNINRVLGYPEIEIQSPAKFMKNFKEAHHDEI
jgi:predicted nucleic acid-binding protein